MGLGRGGKLIIYNNGIGGRGEGGGINELKNPSGKCEGQGGPARGGKLIIYNRGTGGDQRVKESKWKMRRTGGGGGSTG